MSSAADGRRAPEGERLLHGWGRTAPSRATVSAPRRRELDALLACPAPRGVLARGFGRSYGDAAQNAGGRVVLTRRLDGIEPLDGEAGLVRVGGGVSIGALARAVLPDGWFPAVVPGTCHVSVGGAVAADVHGKNHHRDGGFCDHVAALRLALAGGEEVTLRPERDPAGFWATAGGMGLTGVVVWADLRLTRAPTGLMRVTVQRSQCLEQSMERLLEADRRSRYTVAWIDLLARGGAFGRGVVSEGEHATAAQAGAARPSAGGERTLSAPPWPGERGPLRPAAVRLFNALYHRRAPRHPVERLQTVAAFFHPLDGISGWNRLYGRRGLVQYQLVVPLGREEALGAMARRLASDGIPCYLAVLKRLGPGHGRLSFAMDGWTLAMDIPAGAPGLGPALDRLDEAVAAVGGRVYLAKDARLRPELLPVMYPGLARWRAERDRLDPSRAMRSDLARRLGLVGAAAAMG